MWPYQQITVIISIWKRISKISFKRNNRKTSNVSHERALFPVSSHVCYSFYQQPHNIFTWKLSFYHYFSYFQSECVNQGLWCYIYYSTSTFRDCFLNQKLSTKVALWKTDFQNFFVLNPVLPDFQTFTFWNPLFSMNLADTWCKRGNNTWILFVIFFKCSTLWFNILKMTENVCIYMNYVKTLLLSFCW